MTAQHAAPLILFSGLAADAAIFAPQKRAFPQLVVPNWPVPAPAETLDSYAQRLADLHRTPQRAVIGGASFGGIVALHVARYLNPLAVLLIGSIRSPNQTPGYVRALRPLRRLIPLLPVRLMQVCSVPLASNAARRIAPHAGGLVRQFRDSNPAVFRWTVARLLDWKAAPQVPCPVLHVHGRRDFVLPLRCTSPDLVIDDGGHVISLTHPEIVNQFIRQAMERFGGGDGGEH